MESNPFEKMPDDLSEKERKEKEACARISEQASYLFKEAEEKAKKDNDFSPSDRKSGKRYSVENASDYMVAVSQRERAESEKFLESVREKDNYYEEKVASKLKVFLRKEETLLRALAELQTQFPELASLIKAQKPYLHEKLKNSEKDWKR
ncbi:MAG: hypothetical protein ACLFNN_00780 [Candidatus Paceibacterota bacterium]